MIGKFISSDQFVNISSYIGMCASTAAMGVSNFYIAEIYPTKIRNLGVGCSASAAMGQSLKTVYKTKLLFSWSTRLTINETSCR